MDYRKEDIETAKAYLEDPDKYVREFVVTINKKLRHITTYAATDEGFALKQLHRRMSWIIKTQYRTSSHSYAYKKRKSIIDCLENHLGSSTFLKADIHAYFDSIDYDILAEGLLRKKTAEEKQVHEIMLRSCFYKGHLPIGFISSPILSDAYLRNVDRHFSKMNGIIYTRYADDLIISCKEGMEDSLPTIKQQLSDSLARYKLELNSKKTYIRKLKHTGDSIHLLGVNLVSKGDGTNRITVSDRYLRQISMDYGKVLAVQEDDNLKDYKELVVKGKIRFVYDCSQESYSKLKKIIFMKTGAQEKVIDRFIGIKSRG